MHPEGHYMYIHILLYKDALLSIKAYFLKTWFLPLLISYVKSVKKKIPCVYRLNKWKLYSFSALVIIMKSISLTSCFNSNTKAILSFIVQAMFAYGAQLIDRMNEINPKNNQICTIFIHYVYFNCIYLWVSTDF